VEIVDTGHGTPAEGQDHIGQRDGDGTTTFDDVVVGQHETIGREDHARRAHHPNR